MIPGSNGSPKSIRTPPSTNSSRQPSDARPLKVHLHPLQCRPAILRVPLTSIAILNSWLPPRPREIFHRPDFSHYPKLVAINHGRHLWRITAPRAAQKWQRFMRTDLERFWVEVFNDDGEECRDEGAIFRTRELYRGMPWYERSPMIMPWLCRRRFA